MTEGDRYPKIVPHIQDLVVRGANMLDTIKPGWDARIDLISLNLQSPCNCVLGHVYGSYSSGVSEMRQWLAKQGEDSCVEAEDYGFDMDSVLAELHEVPTDSYWDILLEEWKSHIKQRRENG
jgi:hypothetical protein